MFYILVYTIYISIDIDTHNIVCTHPNNNSQKFQNSNPEIKWINGELNNKLFYKIFLIILKWFLLPLHNSVSIYKRREPAPPPFSIRTYRETLMYSTYIYMIYFTCIIIGNNILCFCIQNISKKENRKNTKWKLQIFHPSVPYTTATAKVFRYVWI